MSRPEPPSNDYVRFREPGVPRRPRGCSTRPRLQELLDHADELVAREPELLRVHMLHRRLAIHERFLLHPRVLDVLAALIGPDVLALQTMLFFKSPPAWPGLPPGFVPHPHPPDTLFGAWLAIDRADEQNGCLWMTVGSQHEPVYPDTTAAATATTDSASSRSPAPATPTRRSTG